MHGLPVSPFTRASSSPQDCCALLRPLLTPRPVAPVADADRNRIVKLNAFVHDRLRIFWKRKHSEKSMGLGRLPYQTLVRLGLYQFGYS